MSALGRACVKTRLGEGCAALFSQLPSSERSCQYNRLPHRRNRDGQKATNAIGFRRSAFASATDMKIARQMLWKTSADGRLPGSIQPLWMNGRFAPEPVVRLRSASDLQQTSRCRVARSPAASGAASRRGLTHQSTHVLWTLASPPGAPGVAANADRFSRSAT
jgi:hypothetical protein